MQFTETETECLTMCIAEVVPSDAAIVSSLEFDTWTIDDFNDLRKVLLVQAIVLCAIPCSRESVLCFASLKVLDKIPWPSTITCGPDHEAYDPESPF